MAGERIDRRSMASFVFRPVASTGAFRDVAHRMRPHLRRVAFHPQRQFDDRCRVASLSCSRKAWPLRCAVLIMLAAVGFGSVCTGGHAADRIVLRDLTVIADQMVREFNLDGVVLADGNRLRWDEIESGKLAANQAEFDQLLREIGGPLYRVRQRLKVGDYRGASEPVEELYPRFVGRLSESAFLVLHTTVWSRISAGHREAAVAPWLRCFALLQKHPEYLKAISGDRRLSVELETGLCADLLPVWLDAEQARLAMPQVREAAQAIPEPRPDGVLYYAGTLALAAGDRDWGGRVLASLNQADPAARELQLLAKSAIAFQEKKCEEALAILRSGSRWSPGTRPLAWYSMGLAEIASHDAREKREGVLHLLRLPAGYSTSQPELCGAALYFAINTLESLDDQRGSVALRRELTNRFGDTVFAKRVQVDAHETPSEK